MLTGGRLTSESKDGANINGTGIDPRPPRKELGKGFKPMAPVGDYQHFPVSRGSAGCLDLAKPTWNLSPLMASRFSFQIPIVQHLPLIMTSVDVDSQALHVVERLGTAETRAQYATVPTLHGRGIIDHGAWPEGRRIAVALCEEARR